MNQRREKFQLHLPLLAARLLNLQVGEALVLEAGEWRTKSSPYRVANNLAKHHGWKLEQGRSGGF